MNYYVVRCPECGRHSGMTTGLALRDASYACNFCGIRRVVKGRSFGLNVGVWGPMSSTEMSFKVRELNTQQEKL